MLEKVKLEETALEAVSEKNVKRFSSGSTMLDLTLNGGWPLGRTFNIVGDKSTGKTLLAIEAFANFKIEYPNGRMRYAEAEAAFDDSFAEILGFPEEVERPDEMLHTVEEFQKDYYQFIEEGGPGLYILDSLDALSDDAEVIKFEKSLESKKKQDEGDEDQPKQKGSYGVAKAKKMSEMFRLLTQKAQESQCSLGVISQLRDNVGVMFGEKYTRSGGHALDFYASAVVWLHESGKLKRIAKGQERVIGISVRSKVKKLKIGFPFREADYDIVFAYGIDDEMSMIAWLKKVQALNAEAAKQLIQDVEANRDRQNFAQLQKLRDNLRKDCTAIWNEIEAKLAPPIRKYGNPVVPLGG